MAASSLVHVGPTLLGPNRVVFEDGWQGCDGQGNEDTFPQTPFQMFRWNWLSQSEGLTFVNFTSVTDGSGCIALNNKKGNNKRSAFSDIPPRKTLRWEDFEVRERNVFCSALQLNIVTTKGKFWKEDKGWSLHWRCDWIRIEKHWDQRDWAKVK